MKHNYFLLVVIAALMSTFSYSQTYQDWGVTANGYDWDTSFVNSPTMLFTFENMPLGAHGNATLVIYQDGDFGASSEFCEAFDNGTSTLLGQTSQNANGDCTLDSMEISFSAVNLDTWQNNGDWVLQVLPTAAVDAFCGTNGDMFRVKAKLTFDYCSAGTPVEYAAIDADTTLVCPHTTVQLTGVPTVGSFSGIGVSGSIFDPSSLNAGSYTVTYTGTDAIGCETSDQITLKVLKTPGDLEFLVCEGELAPAIEPINIPYGYANDIDFESPIDTAAGYSYGPVTISPEIIYYGIFSTNNTFILDTVLQTNAVVVDHNNETGDDRGGIAITDSTVYVVGDNNTARYDVDLLTAGVVLPRRDGLFSDLDTRKLWSLYNTSTSTMPDNYPSNYEVDAIIALDADLNVTSDIVMLSEPIVMGNQNNWNNGIFAGFGKLGLFNGDTGEFFVVDLNSGLVELVNTLNLNLFWSENWADWGTLGFDGQEWLVNYRTNSSSQIVEHNINTDVSTEITSFSNVSDMSSFTYHHGNNRMYFHYEGGGQFGGTSETLGYVDAAATVILNPNGSVGCPSQITYTFNSIDLGNDTTICQSQAPIVLEAGFGFDSYSWNGDNSNWNIYPVSTSGQYIVEATDASGCNIVDTIEVTVDPCLSTTAFDMSSMTVYPNPSTGIFSIDFNTNFDRAVVKIIDLTGKVCYNKEVNDATSTYTVDANHLENGVYVLSVEMDGTFARSQIVVTK